MADEGKGCWLVLNEGINTTMVSLPSRHIKHSRAKTVTDCHGINKQLGSQPNLKCLGDVLSSHFMLLKNRNTIKQTPFFFVFKSWDKKNKSCDKDLSVFIG